MSEDQYDLLIRPIEPRDAPEVSALVVQLGYDRPVREVAAWIESLGEVTPAQTAFVACIGSEIVGWVEVAIERRIQSAPYALIGGLVVKDGFRGRRIGLRLCNTVEAWTWSRGIELLRVTSRSTRPGAHRFYERNGYQATKISHVFEKRSPR